MATKSKKNTKKASTKAVKKQPKKTKKVSPAYVDKNVTTYTDDTAVFVPSNLKVYQTDDALKLAEPVVDNANTINTNNTTTINNDVNITTQQTCSDIQPTSADDLKLKENDSPAYMTNIYTKEYKSDNTILIVAAIVVLVSMLALFAL